MCGIFGFVANASAGLTFNTFDQSVRTLLKLSERRGRESAGLAVSAQGRISVFKQATKPSAMLKNKAFAAFLRDATVDDQGSFSDTVAVIGHSRLVTNGTQAIPENNQPIETKHLVGVHNGIVTNDRDLARSRQAEGQPLDLRSDSDSEVLFNLIDQRYASSGELASALAESFEEIEGAASIAALCTTCPALALATNTGSLYTGATPGTFISFGSERYIVSQFIEKTRSSTPTEVKQLSAGQGALISYPEAQVESFSLQSLFPPGIARKRIEPQPILDRSQKSEELKRCVRCVLPETYPYISFDEDGVCSYCNEYQVQEYLGRDALEVELSKYRSKNGEPDCIVGFSGGRDSCYALHVLKNEFDMHPIAYTYDWAMVTDLARRNQAKVTGKLGVELIIRAADIHTKRRYIRKNIYAWLKRPRLGMVPLFMAGDKWFYYYGTQLRKETGIQLTIFGAGQQFEQMEFKAGFCGVEQRLQNNTKLYHFGAMNKAKMAAYYIREYLLNPGYINESFYDSIFSFYASFLNKDDYLYLYRYLLWDENVIEKTLADEYGWESDEKFGQNQWRMGDGHTAFIDYIYHTVSGFSEFDVFRSHQIRQGVLTREDALKLVEADNKPKVEMLQDFSQLIGFNLEEVLLRINAVPKLY